MPPESRVSSQWEQQPVTEMVNCLTWMLVETNQELTIAYFKFSPPRPRLAQEAGAPIKLFLDFENKT